MPTKSERRFPDTRLIVQAMGNGAITVLEKPVCEQELWDAIHFALARDSEVRRVDAAHADIRARFTGLSHRERAVLQLVIEGKTNKSIAHSLSLSVRTIENSRSRIFKKTQADSLAEVLRLVYEARLDLDDL